MVGFGVSNLKNKPLVSNAGLQNLLVEILEILTLLVANADLVKTISRDF